MTDTPSDDARFFASPDDWRRWLEANHASATEVWVGYHKKGTGRPSLVWREAVDVALCFGWIDGIAKSIDEGRYRQRFTPRRKGSIWSGVNIARIEALSAEGLMHPAGLAAFEARTAARSNVYAHEQSGERAAFDAAQEARFREHAAAWAFFESQPASYRRSATWWVVSAKQAATRERRLATLIEDSAAGRRLKQLTRP